MSSICYTRRTWRALRDLNPRLPAPQAFARIVFSLSVIIRTRLRALFAVCGRLVKELLGTRWVRSVRNFRSLSVERSRRSRSWLNPRCLSRVACSGIGMIRSTPSTGRIFPAIHLAKGLPRDLHGRYLNWWIASRSGPSK